MNRRNFVRGVPAAAIGAALLNTPIPGMANDLIHLPAETHPLEDRQYWIKTLTKIADPVLMALSANQLRATMPVAVRPGNKDDRGQYTHLEAVGRLLAGLAPWLALGPENTEEGKLRKKYIDLSIKGIAHGVDPDAADFLNFDKTGNQSLVDAAFLAQGLSRAPRQLYNNLDTTTQKNLIAALKSTRKFKPGMNNWVLFSAMIEAALLQFTGDYNAGPVEFALSKMKGWYEGDGMYGDGKNFHWDYYNSFVMHPMLMDVYKVMTDKGKSDLKDYETETKRAQRYAVILERFISPEGTYPVIGRSITYRVGAFQSLSQVSLMKILPATLSPAQVRCALTAAMKRSLGAKDTFDENGWLQIGFCGHQPHLAEDYISTGSLYLAAEAFLALGLAPGDEFWTAQAADWTSRKIYKGEDLPNDHAIAD